MQIFAWLKSITLFLVLCTVTVLCAMVVSFKGDAATARLFTGPWFYPLYALLALNLLFCGIDYIRRRRRGRAAFILIHLGVLATVGGAVYGHFAQVKGYMTVFQDESETRVFDYDTRKVVAELPFTVHLDRFWIQYYEDEGAQDLYVLAFLDRPRKKDGDRPPHLILPVPPGEKPAGTLEGYGIRVEEVLPHASVKAEEQGTPVLEIRLKESGKVLSFPVEKGKPIRVDELDTVFTPKELFRHAQVAEGGGLKEGSELPANPALVLEVRRPPDAEPETKYLFAFYPDMSAAMGGHGDKAKKESPFFFDDDRYSAVYKAPEYAFLVTPLEKGGVTAVKISVTTRKGERFAHWYFPGHDLLPSQRRVTDDLVVEAMARENKHVKDYKSKLSILEGGELSAAKVIEVNDPLIYKGWWFLQSGYDDRGGRYSVLQVVRDPGLFLVMAGFLLIMIGTIQQCWLDPFFRSRSGKPREGA